MLFTHFIYKIDNQEEEFIELINSLNWNDFSEMIQWEQTQHESNDQYFSKTNQMDNITTTYNKYY